jgi:3-isopropylmalate/(R)-2-methylmalate dehydratase small subunit
MILSGRVWKYGDGIGATDLVSARYDKEGMRRQWDECAKHVLEDIDPAFATKVQEGDLLVAGSDLGAGHAHYYEAAVMGSAATGLRALLAESVNALFFRAAIDAGVTTWAFPGLSELVETGHLLEIDMTSGAAKNFTTGATMQLEPVSPIVLDILDAGGSKNWALRRVGAGQPVTDDPSFHPSTQGSPR